MDERNSVQVMADAVEEYRSDVVLTCTVSHGLAYLQGIMVSAEVLVEGLYTSAAWASDPGIKASVVELIRLFDACLKELRESRGGLRMMPTTLQTVAVFLERMDEVRRAVR